MNYQPYRPSSFNLLPDVVKNLLIINGLVFLSTSVLAAKFGIDLNSLFGLYYFTSPEFHYTQFITHLFLHGSFWHLLSNMFALWMFGNMLENIWGSKRFLTFYLVCGLGAALIHTLATGWELNQMKGVLDGYAANPNLVDFEAIIYKYNAFARGETATQLSDIYYTWQQYPNSPFAAEESVKAIYRLFEVKRDIPTVGASGAVFGVLLAFGMMFPNMIIYLYFALPIKAKYFVALFGLYELYSGFQNHPADNVAHFAHLGGMLFGFILIRYWRNKRRNYYG
jgi:membrane associated rhomboid family serine protease